MKNKILIGTVIAIIVIILAVIGIAMVLDEKGKFIGTWQYSDGGTITFHNDNTVNIDNIGPLGEIELIGVYDYSITNNQITFTSGSIGVTLNYRFSDVNTLILSNDAGLSITLNKI
jgi:hypothetical protein